MRQAASLREPLLGSELGGGSVGRATSSEQPLTPTRGQNDGYKRDSEDDGVETAYDDNPPDESLRESTRAGYAEDEGEFEEDEGEVPGYRSEPMLATDAGARLRPQRLPPSCRHPMTSFGGKGGAKGGARGGGHGNNSAARRAARRDERLRLASGARSSPIPPLGSTPPSSSFGGGAATWEAATGAPPMPARCATAPVPGSASAGRLQQQDPLANIPRCTAYCVSLSLRLVGLDEWLQRQGWVCAWYKDGLNGVVHCAMGQADDEEQPHVFFFSYGCVVTWGLSENQERRLLDSVTRDHAHEPLPDDEVEFDDFGYVDGVGQKLSLLKDTIKLSSRETREKLAISFALAQSAKLGCFETTVEKTIQSTKDIPQKMAVDGKIKLNRKDITRQIGQLFVDRSSINLYSDILDNPDFFWEDDEWLPVYSRVAKYLEVDRRADVLNKRLDILKELFDMLATELHNSHSNKLEWIVIILIMVEVLFQVIQIAMGMTA